MTLWVIKFKGIKKKFSQDPIDFIAIRKEDVFQPKGLFFKKHITQQFQIAKTLITEVSCKGNPKKLLLFIHGGAFISGPAQHHWDTIKTIAKKTDYTIWMCNYPKAPEHKIEEISKNIDAVYSKALEQFTSDNVILIGDSVGGTLAISLIQRLIVEKKPLPLKTILISPVMDASMSNIEIDTLDIIDPMLSKTGILSAKKMCAGSISLQNEIISPLYGSFEEFPETILFLSENDIMYPDQKLAVEKFIQAGVHPKVILGENMPHIWPLLPVMKEAKIALHQLIKLLV